MVVWQTSVDGTDHENVIVPLERVPQSSVFPKLLLWMVTSTPVPQPPLPTTASVAPTIVPVTVSPAWTFQCVLLRTCPVCGRLPVGLSSDPKLETPASTPDAKTTNAAIASTTTVTPKPNRIRIHSLIGALPSLILGAAGRPLNRHVANVP